MEVSACSMRGLEGLHSLNSASILSTSGWSPAVSETVLWPEQEAKQTRFPRLLSSGPYVVCDLQD